MDGSVKRKIEDVDLDTIIDDIAVLKRDIARILDHVKTATVDNALDSAHNLADHLGDEAEDLYKDLSKRGQRTAKAINRQVEDNPGMSMLVAFGVGLLAGRMFR